VGDGGATLTKPAVDESADGDHISPFLILDKNVQRFSLSKEVPTLKVGKVACCIQPFL
jgi:hypothetical protein